MHKHIYSHIRGLKPMLGLFDSTHITYNDECIDLILWNKSLVSITTNKKLPADWLVTTEQLTSHNQALCQSPPPPPLPLVLAMWTPEDCYTNTPQALQI